MHIYNFISATRVMIMTSFTREPRHLVGVALGSAVLEDLALAVEPPIMEGQRYQNSSGKSAGHLLGNKQIAAALALAQVWPLPRNAQFTHAQ